MQEKEMRNSIFVCYTFVAMNKWFGDRKFYAMVMRIALPVILQNIVTNFVNMLDNIMVGRLGTLEMSGVSITNQLLTIFNLTIFGAVTAAGIFSAQYIGKGDEDGVRNCLRAKFLITGIFTILGLLIFILFGKDLILLYMDSSVNSAADISYTLSQAWSYLLIMCIGLVPFAISNSIGSTFREGGNTVLPMIASWVAVAVNFVGNLVLIFGYLGFPRLGVQGAAIATVLSRFTECIIIVVGVRHVQDDHPYFKNVFRTMRIPRSLMEQIIRRGSPLLVNEVLWSIGIAAISQCYSTRGLNSVAAFNISNTIQNIFYTLVIGMGTAISIIVGQRLGAEKKEEAVDCNRKITVLAVLLCVAVGIVMIFASPYFTRLYNTSEEVLTLANQLLKVVGIFLPVSAAYTCFYFTLRSGGKTVITFLFDAGFTCVVSFPAAFVLSRFTTLNVIEMFVIVTALDMLKAVLGLVLVHKRVWVNNLTVE